MFVFNSAIFTIFVIMSVFTFNSINYCSKIFTRIDSDLAIIVTL